MVESGRDVSLETFILRRWHTATLIIGDEVRQSLLESADSLEHPCLDDLGSLDVVIAFDREYVEGKLLRSI